MSSPLVTRPNNFIVFGSPLIEDDEIADVICTMKSGWLGTGPKVDLFERKFKLFKHAENAVAVSSCTAALHLSILAAGLSRGDEVITTPLTFCATVNAIIHAGAIPVLVDVDPRTMNIDPKLIEEKITDKTRALLPVHFGGRPCDMDAICSIASRHGLKLIEDCAHAIETEYKGRKVGTFGDFGCFSFYITKNITTGEGGIVLTRREEDADLIKVLALHGMTKDAWKRFSDEGYKHYQVVTAGFKYNMTDLQAAIGIHQLGRINRYWERRKNIWNLYTEAFSNLSLELPAPPEPETRHAYHLYTVLVDQNRAGLTRDAFLDAMIQRHVGVGVHYVSLPEHPYYQKMFNWKPEDYPASMAIGRQTVSLPLSPKLEHQDVETIIKSVRSILNA